jgi:hypothetical protein
VTKIGFTTLPLRQAGGTADQEHAFFAGQSVQGLQETPDNFRSFL